MTCANQIGVQNITMTFRDCNSNQVYGPVFHELATEEQPQYKLCPNDNEAIPGGFVRVRKSNQMMTLSVIRNLGIPLALYQGCASVDIVVEHLNGLVYTGIGGTSTGSESSDGHEVTIEASFKEIDELRPETLSAA